MDAAALHGTTALIHGDSAEVVHVLCEIIFIYCGIRALFHKELKKVFLFSFVGLVVDIRSLLTLDSHLALSTFFFHVFNFTIIVLMMFMVASSLSKKAGSKQLDDMRGIGRVCPRLAIPLGLGLFAMMGLPPFSSFFSKMLMVFAFVDSGKIIASIFLAGGEILYFLVFIRVFRIIFLDKYTEDFRADDSNYRSLIPLYLLVVFIVIGGLFPASAFKPFAALADIFGASAAGAPPLSFTFPLPVLVIIGGAVVVYFFGKKSAVTAALSAAGICMLAMVPLSFSPSDVYGRWFAWLILLMGTLQFVYSAGYMEHSHKQYRFYCFFLLMIAGLLGVSLSSDLWSMFVYWEIMSGWVMYLALVHEEDSFSIQEASKYFTFNFAGAALLTVAVCGMYENTGHWGFQQISQQFSFSGTGAVAVVLLTVGCLMKAAQLPFRIDFQMHPKPAPTPISGYISSTVLKSGPFLLVKIFFIAGAGGATTAAFISLAKLQYISGWIGALTIVMAASFAMLTNSMKRLLIFHTVSQLGYVVVGCSMMTAIGLAGGLLHFVNHMFFKNLLFLCAGAVFISTGTDRMDRLGGLARKMPVTFFCFMVGVLSISGVPMFSGFVSKWMIYHAALDSGLTGIAAFSLFGSVLTLASFIKFMHSAYLGQLRDDLLEVKEASWYMLVPMLALTGLSIFLGILPGVALAGINRILEQFNLTPLGLAAGLLQDVTGSLDTLHIALMLLTGGGIAGGMYMLVRRKIRTTHVCVCGVGDLKPGDSHVASTNFYEDAKAFIKAVVRVTKKSIGLQGDYIER